MKIAVNTRFLLKDKLEGIGWVTYELLKRMVEQHPEDEFLFFFDRAYDERFVFGKNVQPIVLAPPARHPFLWFIWFEIAIPRALKKYKPDVFLSTDGYCSIRATTKTVMITHDIAHLHFPEQIPTLVKKYYNKYVPLFLNRANQIISVSHFTKSDIIEQYGIEANKISVVHNGCREGFHPLDNKEQEKIREKYAEGASYFFYVGAVHPRKNLHRLLLAFDQFKKKNKSTIRLLLGGRFAWQTDEVKDAFELSDHQDDIKFLGYVPEEDLPKVMASAYAFVYPSLFEGFGLPLLEAMHCDVPVITSTVSSLPEVTGEAGIKINPQSIDEIANALEKIYLDTTLRSQLIQVGRQQRTQFNWDVSAEKVYSVLKNVVLKV